MIKLGNFFVKTAIAIASIILLLFTVIAGILRANIVLDARESISFSKNGLLFLVFAVLIIICLYFSQYLLKKIKANSIFLFFCLLYVIAGIFLILNVSDSIRADALSVNQAALAFNNGDFSNLLTGQYMNIYPHQLGLASYERLIYIFTSNMRVFFIVNLVLVLLINFVQWKICELILPQRELVHKYLIALSFLFLPQFFFILFVYGTIPGLSCMCTSLYFMVKYFKTKKSLFCVLSIFFVCFAVLLRQNYIIGAIAIAIVYFIFSLREKNWKPVLASVMIFVSLSIANKGISFYYQMESDINFDSAGIPKSLFFAMGLQDDESLPVLGGWYNSYNYATFQSNNWDYDATNEVATENIKERLLYFVKDPGYAALFFLEKIASTWSEATFQSIWTGPLINAVPEQTVNTSFLTSLYSGGVIYKLYAQIMHAFLFISYFLSLIFLGKNLLHKKEIDYYSLFAVVFLIGGFLFHLLWETKSQYVYPYFFILIPIVAASFEDLSYRFNRLFDSRRLH